MGVAHICCQLREFLEVFPYLADRHELETTKKNLTSHRATLRYTRTLAGNCAVSGFQVPGKLSLEALHGAGQCWFDCYFKPAKLTRAASKLQPVITELRDEMGGKCWACGPLYVGGAVIPDRRDIANRKGSSPNVTTRRAGKRALPVTVGTL